MNYSQQRNCIMNIVVSNPVHPTAEQVYDIARRSYPKISLGTVYRNLNQLADLSCRQNEHFRKNCIFSSVCRVPQAD